MKKNKRNFLKISILMVVITLMLMIPLMVASAASPPMMGQIYSTQNETVFNFTKFFEAAEGNAMWVVFVVLGLVTVWGKLGLTGKIQLVSSLATGLVIGSLFMIAALGFPNDFKGWFSVIIYGLGMGLVASGIYETGKELTAKTAAKVLGLPGEKGKG